MTTLHPRYTTAVPQAWLDCQRAQRQSWQSWQRAQGLTCVHLWQAIGTGSASWPLWQRASQRHSLALGHDCFDAGMQCWEQLLALVHPGRLLRPLWRCGQRCVSSCHHHGNAGMLDYARQALR